MAPNDNCFTYTWKIKNISYCVQRKAYIYSPIFVVDLFEETKWYLRLCPRGEKEYPNYIGFWLFRDANCQSDAKVSITYELAFILKDGSVQVRRKEVVSDFRKDANRGSSIFAEREVVFNTKRSEFLPKDTLTARCRIWNKGAEVPENVLCFACTRIGVEKRSFLWNLKNFSTLEPGKEYTYEIKSVDRYKQLMSVNLFLTEGTGSDEIIGFKLNLADKEIVFSSLLLSLVDVSRNRIECNREVFWFDDESKAKFKFFFTKNRIMAMKSSYLQDDVLSLHWEWVFSKGVVSEEIEDVQYASTSSERKSSNAQNGNNRKLVPLLYPLNDNLKSLCDENFLCDVKLKTVSCTFNAHKVVLSASSSVFKAMFSSDMKEKNSNCVNIEDLSDDTMGRLLAFIYTARIEDLTWEVASQLYEAADKYAIFSLKSICSSYIEDNLSPINACDILLLSDLHSDDDLKSSVQDYMLKHLKEIINSDGWKLLLQTNSTLAAETLSLPYK